MSQSEKQKAEQIYKSLDDEKQKWVPVWRDIRDYINPYIGFFDGEESNSGERIDENLIRTMSIKYSNIFAAGLQWGVTSPTRPWVKLGFRSPQLMQNGNVLGWLNIVKDITLDVLAKGGFYTENHKWYLELGDFCTAAMMIEEGDDTVIHCHTFTCGEYALGIDHRGRYNQFAMTIKLSPAQMIDKFGEENVPKDIITARDNNDSKLRDVKHLIIPNPDYDKNKIDNKSMKFKDLYWTDGCKEDEWLKEGGFNLFPIMAMPFQKKGADIYGTGPGMWSLGDAKAIQLIVRDMATAVELGVNPALQAAASSMQGAGINSLPSGVNFYNPTTGGSGDGIKPLFNVNLNIQSAMALMQSFEECEKEHFCVKVFQLISDMEKGTRTAREVIELSSEKMSQMGPLLESLQDYLNMIVERVMDICFRAGVYPPPPPEIQGMEMDVEFTSILAQAQKQQSLTPITDTVQSAIAMASGSGDMSILDKIDFDEVVDQVGGLNGSPPSIIRSDEIVAQIRAQRQQAQAQAQQMQALQQGIESAKSASQADMSGDNALTRLVGPQ